jgi:hypothetical protein
MAGFWAGFGTTLAKNIEERKQYARDRAAKRQEYLQTYGTRAIVEREQQAQSAMGTINFLQSKGMSQDQLRYVLDKNGLQGIAQLKAEISSRDDLSKDDVAKIIKMSEDYVANNPDEDLLSTVRRAYGLYKGGDNPVEKDRNIFAAVLGYDSGAVEGEVLDDLYVNGYTGRDIYRIMGSSPQVTGEALEYDMPAKPHSSTTYANTYNVLDDRFEAMVDSQIKILESQWSSAPDSTTKQNLQDQIEELNVIKGQGIGGVGDFEGLGFDASPIYKLAQQQEELLPGVIKRNPNLGTFRTLYESYTTEDRTEEALGDGSTDNTPSDTTPKEPPQTKTTHTFDTKAERDAAILAGVVKQGDNVILSGSEPVVYTGPTMGEEAGVTAGPDDGLREGSTTSGPAGGPLPNTLESGSIEERAAAKRAAVEGAIDTAVSGTGSVISATGDYLEGLDAGMGSAAMTGSSYVLTGLGAVAQALNLQDGADYLYRSAVAAEDTAEEIDEKGLRPYINEMLDKLGVPDVSDDWTVQEAAEKIFSAVKLQKGTEEELTAAAERAPDHVQKLGGQMSEAWAKAQEMGGPVLDTFNQIFGINSPRGRKMVDDLMYFNEVGPVGLINDWLESNPDAPEEEVAKVMDIVINPRAIGTVGFQDLGLREDVRDKPEVVEELRKVGLIMPVPDDSMDAKARRGTGRTAMIEPVRPSQTPDPLKTARTLAKLRRENPEYFIDTPPSVTDGDTASQVAAQAPAGGDRAPNNAGLMSRPVQPSKGMTDTQPDVMSDIDAVKSMVGKVHGASSTVAKSLDRSESMTAADVTKLINKTEDLPKTETRDKLLTSLYELRDKLNNR